MFVLAARLSGKQVALTLHGAELDAWLARRPARRWTAAVLRRASVAFVLHDADARTVRRLGTTPVRLVANPVSGPDRPSRAPVEATVLFLGEQCRRKGIDVLAGAWPEVLRRRPAARLVVAGPDRGEGTLCGPGVVNLGAVGPDRARELIHRATVVVLPSRAEALPMVLLEGMSEGVPFVASAVAGIPRLAAAGGGLLVRPGDAAGLAEALDAVLGDPALRDRLGRAGGAWWERHATPAAVHEALLEGYRAARPQHPATQRDPSLHAARNVLIPWPRAALEAVERRRLPLRGGHRRRRRLGGTEVR
jgi:glycosyltransferase involved in cell wall biosynthesis